MKTTTEKAKELLAIIRASDNDEILLLEMESFILKIERDAWVRGLKEWLMSLIKQ